MSPKPVTHSIEPYLLLGNSDGCFRVPLQQIIYCSSYNSSTVFKTTGKHKIVVAKPMAYYEQLLKPYGFVRIHHSTVVNIAYTCHSGKNDDANELTLTNGEKLIISRPKRNDVIEALQKWSIEVFVKKAIKQDNPPKKQINSKNKQVSHKQKQKNKNKTH